MDRQRNVLDAAPSVVIILGEGALRLQVGSSTIMTQQLDHLGRVGADVRVLPFSAGPSPRRSAFALLDFDDPDDPAVAYIEVPGGARYFDRPEERDEYEYVWKILMRKSVPIEEWRP